MNLRDALREDAERISSIAIRSKAHWEYSKEFIQACRQDLTIDENYIQNHNVFVLEEKEEIVGFFTFIRGEMDRLDFLYIDPKYIGKGFGRITWEHVIQKAQEMGVKSFTIDSDPNAKAFYEKMGAKQIGEIPSTVFKDRFLPLMKFTVEDN
ncbi:GNAT family N-acetyltransferase [Bacillus spongiae]|uniref:GNAT family N-acetyltransferase n=1 Tax=Bacillus spongiae TaxID=2683610 RepID=A0ABU8H9G6_9BACI